MSKNTLFSDNCLYPYSDCGLLNMRSSVIASSDDITFGTSFINRLNQNAVISNPVSVDLGLQKWRVSTTHLPIHCTPHKRKTEGCRSRASFFVRHESSVRWSGSVLYILVYKGKLKSIY